MLKKTICFFKPNICVRYIRGRQAVPSHVQFNPKNINNEENTRNRPLEEKLNHHPLHVLDKSTNKSNIIPKAYEVIELQKEKLGDDKPKQILGRHVAEDIRSRKKEVTGAPERFSVVKCPDMSKLGQVEFAKLLRKQVIYADENLVIFNKPYGISAHDDEGNLTSLKSSLPILSKMVYGINTSIPLSLCNRLDKGTTGITVCAANKDLAADIIRLFRQQKVRKKYWAITVGTPSPRQGIIDIAMISRHVEGKWKFRSHTKMGLASDQKLDYESGNMIKVKQRKSDIAITHYKTLDDNKGLSLIEFQPLTTVKHQLRVHASEALSCCILGDHKYSYVDNLLPQRLPRNILAQFHIRSTRSRDMPMHLHLREIVIPGILQSTGAPHLLVSAKLPEHMHRTTKLFKLKPGSETQFFYPMRLASKPNIKHSNPHMEELYIDPFPIGRNDTTYREIQREDCYAIYKPKVKVKFQYRQN